MLPSFPHASRTNYYFGIDVYTFGAVYMANFESITQNGWYLDIEVIHHLTNNLENIQIREDYKGVD